MIIETKEELKRVHILEKNIYLPQDLKGRVKKIFVQNERILIWK